MQPRPEAGAIEAAKADLCSKTSPFWRALTLFNCGTQVIRNASEAVMRLQADGQLAKELVGVVNHFDALTKTIFTDKQTVEQTGEDLAEFQDPTAKIAPQILARLADWTRVYATFVRVEADASHSMKEENEKVIGRIASRFAQIRAALQNEVVSSFKDTVAETFGNALTVFEGSTASCDVDEFEAIVKRLVDAKCGDDAVSALRATSKHDTVEALLAQLQARKAVFKPIVDNAAFCVSLISSAGGAELNFRWLARSEYFAMSSIHGGDLWLGGVGGGEAVGIGI